LLSLEERAKLLGGSFDLDTTPGKGTHVCIRIPLQSRRPR
jgi:two-component system sensor histidine kinase UhpB